MVTKLQTQLENSEEIKSLLRNVSFSFKFEDGRDANVLLVYLPILGGKSSHQDFFEKIKEGILAHFVFKCSYIKRKLDVENSKTPDELFEQAIRKLSQKTAKGELGELILFTLLDVYLSAPKLLSKIAAKQSSKMPALGADGVHGQYYEDGFRLYLGESKLHADFKGAATHASTSIKKARDNYQFEFDLLETDMDFPEITTEAHNALCELLNPFNDDDISNSIDSACFIGFSEPDIIADEANFESSYKKLAEDYVSNFYSKTSSQEINPDQTILLMLPFSCIDELTNDFVSYMGIQE